KENGQEATIQQKIKRFTKSLIFGETLKEGNSHERFLISSDDYKKIQAETDKIKEFLTCVKKTVGKVEEMQQHEKAMQDQAINPTEFKELYQRIIDNYITAGHYMGKTVTSQSPEEYLSQWQSDREVLAGLITQFKKKPEQVQQQVEKEIHQLAQKAQKTLEKLHSIEDWKAKRAKLDTQTKACFTVTKQYIEFYIVMSHGYIDSPTRSHQDLSNTYANLSYGIRILSGFIDRFDKRSNVSNLQSLDESHDDGTTETSFSHANSDLGLKSPTHRSFERLIQKVSELDIGDSNKYPNEKKLADAIYKLSTIDDQQLGFSHQIDAAEYKQSLLRISPPKGVTVKQERGFIYFSNDKAIERDISYQRRIIINCHPDYILKVAKMLAQKMPNFLCISDFKVPDDPTEVCERLDNIVIYYYDPPERDNTSVLGKCIVDICGRGQYTRPDHPYMMALIDSKISGIRFSDDNGESFVYSHAKPIAAVAWGLKERGQQITSQTLLSETEIAYRKGGIDEDDPQWYTK
ncbi:MAG TPA: hypothetical protein VK553_08735, partial [Candidatus Nitrosopolaris rasttigaisensis]|nr:hypothetical protein [Candidatus Nitrosopolaris rasttigaisensis]